MWALLARQRTDDYRPRGCPARLAGRPATPERRLRLAKTFYAQRLFEQAIRRCQSIRRCWRIRRWGAEA